MIETEEARYCELHEEAPLFRLLSDTKMEPSTTATEQGFCRYCVEGRIRCPHCGVFGTILSFQVEGRVHADYSYDNLRCGVCGEVVAQTGKLA